ncbi:MAG TPA: AAA domain-containing protein [Blastocatellia bacterium]|nr:AAA domain-containing protein [Blastocatellia bacterium]
MATSDSRRLKTIRRGTSPIDRPINMIEDGASMVQVEMPQLITGEVDNRASDLIVSLIERFLDRRTILLNEGCESQLQPRMIGVVCAHVSQVNAVRERLPHYLSEVFVETADRFQGLERPIMIVHHPLSGRIDADQFHLDAGRLCVMLSRHSFACIIVARAGIEDRILSSTPGSDRILNRDRDDEFEGRKSNLSVLQELQRKGRIIEIDS